MRGGVQVRAQDGPGRTAASSENENEVDEDGEESIPREQVLDNVKEHIGEEDMGEEPYDVVELFSPARISHRSRLWEKRRVWNLDKDAESVSTGNAWDLMSDDNQREVFSKLSSVEAEFLWACSPSGQINHLQDSSDGVNQEDWEKACHAVRFGGQMCHLQVRNGGGDAFEHPSSASSWLVKELGESSKDPAYII